MNETSSQRAAAGGEVSVMGNQVSTRPAAFSARLRFLAHLRRFGQLEISGGVRVCKDLLRTLEKVLLWRCPFFSVSERPTWSPSDPFGIDRCRPPFLISDCGEVDIELRPPSSSSARTHHTSGRNEPSDK